VNDPTTSSPLVAATAEGTDPALAMVDPPLDLLLSHPGPLDWPFPFQPYQKDGIRALLARDGLLLADDMGLGKTIQAVAALRILCRRGAIGRALLVAPAGLLPQWRRELRLWAPDLKTITVQGRADERSWLWPAPAHLHLVGYESLRSDWSESKRSHPRRHVWDLLILDEAQRIKNADIDISRYVKRLERRRVWAMTGTPLENRAEDLESILDLVAPGGTGNLAARLAATQLRRRKTEVLAQLPPKTTITVPVALSGSQRRSYDEAERLGIVELRRRGERVTVANILELILRLKQICNICPATGRSAKLEDLDVRLDRLAAQDDRALVFSQFADQDFGVRMLAGHLARFEPLIYAGGIAVDEREETIRRFKADDRHRIMILSLKAGGQGLNLQEASYVFHFDQWWNPATGKQAEDRAHRLGQTRPVTVYRYLVENTVEERVDAILREKQDLFDRIVDGAVDLQRSLTAAELFGLFGLEPPPSVRR
jgi:SNF2 family DNA or RNA helicase